MGMKPAEQCHNWGAECHHLSAWPHLPHRQSRATHGDILFRIIQALWGPRLLCAKSQPTAYLAAKLESTQMTELIIKPSTEPELIPLGCYWAFALSLFYGTLVKRMYIITQLRTHTFPAQRALCLLLSPKSLACRCSSPAAAASCCWRFHPRCWDLADVCRKKEPCCSPPACTFNSSLQPHLPITLLRIASAACGGCCEQAPSALLPLKERGIPCPLINTLCPTHCFSFACSAES